MATPIQPSDLLRALYQVLNAMASAVTRANDLKGGGGYENWTLVQFLLNLTNTGDYDYLREARFGRLRVDIAFNQANVAPRTPAILTEWKCNPDANSLSAGCTGDIEKFVDVLRDTPVGPVLPLPLIIGVGPQGAAFTGYERYQISDSRMFLYLSSADTWKAKNVWDRTWYSQPHASDVGDLSPLRGDAAGEDAMATL